ncbi:MAG: hypothetical protein M0P14_08515 [Alkaliphilus sp.]|nr:hypothetical protein [Alkaliphilus sp.]
MYNLIEEFEEWIMADKKVHINVDNSVDFFEKFPIDKELFLYKYETVAEKLTKNYIYLYLKRTEQYIGKYIKQFAFENYSNLREFKDANNNRFIYDLLKLLQEENFPVIKGLINNVGRGLYDLKAMYNVIRYYDYLIKDTLDYNNYEATLDFLLDFPHGVKRKTEKLSNDNRADKRAKIDIPNIVAEFAQYYMDYTEQSIDILKSASEQTFFMKACN